MPKINPNRDAQIAAYTWAVSDLAKRQALAARQHSYLTVLSDEVGDYLPHLIQLAKSELARRKNNGRKPIGKEPMTPTERSAKRYATGKRLEKLTKENAD